jgi:hypothetical protein
MTDKSRIGALGALASRVLRPRLPMDEASRMERAAELGFTRPGYHITRSDFDQFKLGGGDPRISGDAVWFSPNAHHQPAAHNVAGRTEKFREGTRVIPSLLRTKNPLIIDDQMMLDWAKAAFANDSDMFPHILPKQAADAIRGAGYDSILFGGERLPVYNKEIHKEILILDPRNIRSRFAAFDPEKRNSADIMAGIGAGGIAAAPMLSGDQAEEGKARGGKVTGALRKMKETGNV